MERKVNQWIEWKKNRQQEEQGSEELVLQMEKWMGRAALSYQELAKEFSAYVTKKETLGTQEKSRILEKVSDKLCRSCERQRDCWEENLSACYEAFCDCITNADLIGELAKTQLPEFLRTNCIRFNELSELLNQVTASEYGKLFLYNQMIEGKEALVHQLQETANYLSDMPNHIYNEITTGNDLKLHLKRQLRKYHIQMVQLSMKERRGKGRQLQMILRCEPGRCVSLRLVERVISEQLGHIVRERNQWNRLITEEEKSWSFIEEPDFFTMTGVARTSKHEKNSSGDSFSFFYDEDGRLAMILSDGMGSGEEAAKESETVLKLLEKLLDAGFHEETAIRMMNSVLALRAEQNSFATLDMSMINLYTGTCEFIKIGGAATFLKRRDWLENISTETLPIGMLQKVDYETMEKKLYDGDYIIMMSDGVLDAVPEEQRHIFLKKAIGEEAQISPQLLAGRILKASLIRQNYEPKDDMTVLVCGIFKKNCYFSGKELE